MRSKMRCDVAVIGAGPAGSVAAAALARSGARVLLVDGSHPREKPCGGGYTGRAVDIVRRLVPNITRYGTPIRQARFLDSPGKREAIVDLPHRDASLIVASRAPVDGALVDAAAHEGAVVIRERVRAISPGRPHCITTTAHRFETPFIIGADGANSLVRRTFARPFSRHQLSIATGFYAHGVTSDEIVIEMMDAPAGYIWSFPRADHLAIGICAQATDTTVAAVRYLLARWIRTTGISANARLQTYSWPIPSLEPDDYRDVPLAGEGWITVGDAAGLVDPITREGIFFALRSGEMAADALATATSAAARYSARVREEIGRELAIAARLKAGFFTTQFTHLVLDGLASSARVRSVMADLVAGTQPYSTLKWRLAGTLAFGLAWNWWRLSTQRTA
jgi:geranylgeranyl reductase family protein